MTTSDPVGFKESLDPHSCLRFERIFQRHPTKMKDPNVGDGKRWTCEGVPTLPGVAWCQAGCQAMQSIAQDAKFSPAQQKQLVVLENSILRTEKGAENQIGHFDLRVHSPPTPGTVPPAIIAVTPVLSDASLRILPMGATRDIPTHAEFDRLCVPVPVRCGQTLLMRYDMAHSGTGEHGLRLHSILGRPGQQGSLGNTFPLPVTKRNQ